MSVPGSIYQMLTMFITWLTITLIYCGEKLLWF